MRFIDAEKAAYPITMLCRLVDVSRAGYYAWSQRGPSQRRQADAALAAAIRVIHTQSRQTYGVPRVHATLHAQGQRVSRKRVARLMQAACLQGCGRRRRVRTTVSDPQATPAPNMVARQFSVADVNQLWVTDLTYLWTAEGWLYLAAMLDAHSRRVIGWAMADHLRVELALEALQMALRERRPRRGELVHHSDRGSQYTAGAYQAVLEAHGIRCSMSRKGDCLDNALAESFCATLKRELMSEAGWPTKAEARGAVFEWIAVYYNRQRRHNSIGYRTPVEFETSKAQLTAA
jgi:transposase InsO family protein